MFIIAHTGHDHGAEDGANLLVNAVKLLIILSVIVVVVYLLRRRKAK